VLVPLYDFYPSIESFIDGMAKKSIDQAPENPALQPYDSLLLKAMFLIRYIPDIVKPNVDNLATLCLDQIDADKLALKRKIQESLARLEQQRLVSRNGDLWFFLTNEERDVAREIGHVEVSPPRSPACWPSWSLTRSWATRPRCATATPRPTTNSTACSTARPGARPTTQLDAEVLSPVGDDYELMTEAKCIGAAARAPAAPSCAWPTMPAWTWNCAPTCRSRSTSAAPRPTPPRRRSSASC
jgi:hypothetical protein